MKRAKTIITDSGSITEEASIMHVPCMALRNNTERPETITLGANELLGTDPKEIQPAMQKFFTQAIIELQKIKIREKQWV